MLEFNSKAYRETKEFVIRIPPEEGEKFARREGECRISTRDRTLLHAAIV